MREFLIKAWSEKIPINIFCHTANSDISSESYYKNFILTKIRDNFFYGFVQNEENNKVEEKIIIKENINTIYRIEMPKKLYSKVSRSKNKLIDKYQSNASKSLHPLWQFKF